MGAWLCRRGRHAWRVASLVRFEGVVVRRLRVCDRCPASQHTYYPEVTRWPSR